MLVLYRCLNSSNRSNETINEFTEEMFGGAGVDEAVVDELRSLWLA